MEFGIIGTSVWQQNMPLLAKLTLDRETRTEALEQLKARLDLDEVIYLATCNRVELFYATRREGRGARLLHRYLDFFLCGNNDVSFFPNDFYHYTGREAITHLFRTTSSLESVVVGETQITGQFKQAWLDAEDSGLCGPVLADLAREALTVAKQVKRETSLGEGSLSMASLAAGALVEELPEGNNPTVALVGSGTMTVKLAKYIREACKANLVFVNRTVDKIEGLAKEFDGRVIALDEFIANPCDVSGIVSATAANEPVFDSAFLDRLEDCGHRVVCIDLAIPRDFSPMFDHDERVTLIDIPQLKSRGQGNLRQKFVEAGRANEIVRDAVNRYLSGRIEVSLKPIFHESYQEALVHARQAFGDLFEKKVTALDADQQDAILRLVNKLVAHSSFQPVKKLSDHLVQTRAELSFENIRARREAV